jgi:hypothetical protein
MTGDFYSLDNTKMKQLLTKEQAFDALNTNSAEDIFDLTRRC